MMAVTQIGLKVHGRLGVVTEVALCTVGVSFVPGGDAGGMEAVLPLPVHLPGLLNNQTAENREVS